MELGKLGVWVGMDGISAARRQPSPGGSKNGVRRAVDS